jgi:virulence-associated protein VagC
MNMVPRGWQICVAREGGDLIIRPGSVTEDSRIPEVIRVKVSPGDTYLMIYPISCSYPWAAVLLEQS